MNVKQRADALGTFRYTAVRLMETVALWLPLIPEMEVKVMLGRHIWDFAQHADALGKRTFELRQAEHYTRPAAAPYAELLDGVRSAGSTGERIALMYDVIVPGLATRYEGYLAATDELLDAPSVVIVDRILVDLRRQVGDVSRLRERIAIAIPPTEAHRRQELAIASIVA